MDLPSEAELLKIRQEKRAQMANMQPLSQETKKQMVIDNIANTIKNYAAFDLQTKTHKTTIRLSHATEEETFEFCQDIATMIRINPGYQAFCTKKAYYVPTRVELIYTLP